MSAPAPKFPQKTTSQRFFYDGSDGVPPSGAPQREIYLSELAQSQEDIARMTRTIIRGCDEYGSREHRDYGEEANNDNDAAPAEAQAEAQAAKQERTYPALGSPMYLAVVCVYQFEIQQKQN